MDNRDINSNSGSDFGSEEFNSFEDISSFKEEERDLFSYDNSDNLSGSEDNTFDLNSFSSNIKSDEKEKKKGTKTGKQRALKIILTLFLVGLISVSLVAGAFIFYAFAIVDATMDEDLEDALNFTTTIYVDDGKGGYSEYKRLHGEYNRIWVEYLNPDHVTLPDDYDGVPQMLANAFVAIEDKRFFEHDGVDWKRTFGAFINEFFPIYSSRQGGSTITQQLVKNLTKDNSQLASRKVREIMRARYLEGKYAKDTILECYLNTVPMEHGIYGVEVAANYYYGKSVKDLTIAECASLAGITKSPKYYAPDTNLENNKDRQEDILYEMYDQGYITEEEYNAALEEELNIVANEAVLNQNKVNSYFVDALIDQVTEDLTEEYGYEPSHASQLFYNSGYKIYATVDPKMQEAAESVLKDSATYAIEGKDGALMTGGITIMDYEGNIKALVGAVGEKTTNRGFNCATDAIRQPGSTMKPIAAYAPAIEQNLITYSTIVNDTKTVYNGWTPNNWFKEKYLGNITIQFALERSVNTIPVSLVNKMKPQTSYDFLTQKLGITTLTAEDMNLSPLGMGGTNGGLTTVESAAAFAVFGNGGRYYKPRLYTKVTDQKGNIILECESKPQMAISEDTATVMNHLLQQVVYGERGTGTAAAAHIPHLPIYAKTGTSNDQNDLWFVGGTPYYVASSWCGYEVQQPIAQKYSGIALKMWGQVMSKIHSSLPAKEFENSKYAVDRFYCTESGELATEGCTSTAIGWYRSSNVPTACTMHAGELMITPEEAKKLEEENAESSESSETENTGSSETTE